jgi:ABC-type lipoprotein export system ATPase subunit
MLLEIKGLTKEFQRDGISFPAVKEINLEIRSGDFISIIGRSGSGKSTLLNLIAGVLLPSGGEILLDGKNILNCTDKEISYLRNSTIGYLVQGQSVLPNLTVLDNVRLPFYFFSRQGDARERALELLDQMGIANLSKSYPNRLSGGELRRVAIARALMNRPSVLLADEPTSDLDEENSKEVMRLFREIGKQGTAILLVTHDLDTIEGSDILYRMEAGILKRQEKRKAICG